MTSAHWTPGIGDPTVAGWITVVAYFIAALLCLRARAGERVVEQRWWRGLGVLMILMGINKQLDLQTLFTDIGRDVARADDWYAQRGIVQWDFIVAMMTGGMIAAVVLILTVGRRSGAWVRLSIVALCWLGVFVLIRAASFHHVDAMLGLKLAGVRFNTAMELGPLLLIIWAAWQAKGRAHEPA